MAVHLLSLIIFLSAFSSVFSQSRIRCHPSDNDTLSRIPLYSPIAENGVPDCCSWSSVQCDRSTDHVIGLQLNGVANRNTLSPHSPIFQLRHLRKLSVSCLDIRCQIPNEIEKLTALEDFSFRSYSGPIPSSIANLKNLKMLSISDHLSGTIPVSIGNLRNLTSLILDSNQLNLIPSSIGNLHNLTKLYIHNHYLNGNIPAFIGNLLKLTSLILDMNNLSGSIPESIGNLTSLKILNLDSNNLSGTLPFAIFQLPNLRMLTVRNNRLHGSLPRNIRFDSRLNNLGLSDNLFTGIVPSWLFTGSMGGIRASGNRFSGIEPFLLPKVSHLYLVDFANNLIEEIPKSLYLLKNVTFLTLDQNRISGALNLSMLKDMEKLQFLRLSYNEGLSLVNIKGPFPPSLKELYMDHCNSTEFPNFLNSLPYLRRLSLIGNKMRGEIHWNKGWNRLWRLDASFNFLEGSLTPPPHSLQYLYLSHNNLIGDVPAGFGKLWAVDLSFNRLNGVIQWRPADTVNMRTINLKNNKLHGYIPDIFSYVSILILNGNNFSGKVPRSLANCSSLDTLDIGNNNITDEFPVFLGNLPFLKVLVLSSNNFMGNMAQSKSPKPKSQWSPLFSSLLVLDISNNKFTGFLPMKYIQNLTDSSEPEYQDLENGRSDVSISFNGSKALISDLALNSETEVFGILDLSNNEFSGPIPSSIGDLKALKGLNLNGNKLSGEIPKSIGKLINMESLDISRNELSGGIPPDLIGLKNIAYLNLSYNLLSGPIPKGKYFENTSFLGNVKLCGFPLSKLC